MKKYAIYSFILWIFLATLTFFVYYRESQNFRWIDVPTHFAAGAMISSGLFIISKASLKKTVLFSFLLFVGWEFFEITASSLSEKEFVINIFSESIFNRIQDLLMDTLGFITFFVMLDKNRNNIAIKKESW